MLLNLVLEKFGLEISMCTIFMKFDTQNKSNMLIMNILIEIDDLETPNYKFWQIWSKN